MNTSDLLSYISQGSGTPSVNSIKFAVTNTNRQDIRTDNGRVPVELRLFLPSQVGEFTFEEFRESFNACFQNLKPWTDLTFSICVHLIYLVMVRKGREAAKKMLAPSYTSVTSALIIPRMVWPEQIKDDPDTVVLDSLDLPSYSVDRLNLKQFAAKWSRKIPGTDFFHLPDWKRIESDLPVFSVIKKAKTIHCLNIPLLYQYFRGAKEENHFLAEMYFDEVGYYLHNQFKETWRNEITNALAFGCDNFDSPYIYEAKASGHHFLHMFTNFNGFPHDGWIVPIGEIHSGLNLPKMLDKNRVEILSDKYHQILSGDLNSEFLPKLKSLIQMQAQAARHISLEATGEALVNIFAGLELILISSDESEDREVHSQGLMRTRLAALSYHAKKDKLVFDRHLKKIQNLYRSRNKYVHQGISPDYQDAKELLFMGTIVLESLINMHNLASNQDDSAPVDEKYTYLNWLNDINEAVPHFKKFPPQFPEDLLIDIGVLLP